MQYKLVNVYNVRPQPFTAELILSAEDGYNALVGLSEDSPEGNIAPGLSAFDVPAEDIEETGQFIERLSYDPEHGAPYTPQLV